MNLNVALSPPERAAAGDLWLYKDELCFVWRANGLICLRRVEDAARPFRNTLWTYDYMLSSSEFKFVGTGYGLLSTGAEA